MFKKIFVILFTLSFSSTILAQDSVDLSQQNVEIGVDSEEEAKIIEMARKRLYLGGIDEQDLEVQVGLLKPQKHFGEEEVVEQERQEEF